MRHRDGESSRLPSRVVHDDYHRDWGQRGLQDDPGGLTTTPMSRLCSGKAAQALPRRCRVRAPRPAPRMQRWFAVGLVGIGSSFCWWWVVTRLPTSAIRAVDLSNSCVMAWPATGRPPSCGCAGSSRWLSRHRLWGSGSRRTGAQCSFDILIGHAPGSPHFPSRKESRAKPLDDPPLRRCAHLTSGLRDGMCLCHKT